MRVIPRPISSRLFELGHSQKKKRKKKKKKKYRISFFLIILHVKHEEYLEVPSEITK